MVDYKKLVCDLKKKKDELFMNNKKDKLIMNEEEYKKKVKEYENLLSSGFVSFAKEFIEEYKRFEKQNFYPNFKGSLETISNNDIIMPSDDTAILHNFVSDFLNKTNASDLLYEIFKNKIHSAERCRELFQFQFTHMDIKQRMPGFAISQNKSIAYKEYLSIPLVSNLCKFSDKSVFNLLYKPEHSLNTYLYYLKKSYSSREKKTNKKEYSYEEHSEYTKIDTKTYSDIENTPTELVRDTCLRETGLSVSDYFLRYTPQKEDLFPLHISQKKFQAKLLRKEPEAIQYMNFYESLDVSVMRNIIADIILALINIADFEQIKIYIRTNWISYNEFRYLFNKDESFKTLTTYIHKHNQANWCLIKLLKLFKKNLEKDQSTDKFSAYVLFLITNTIKKLEKLR